MFDFSVSRDVKWFPPEMPAPTLAEIEERAKERLGREPGLSESDVTAPSATSAVLITVDELWARMGAGPNGEQARCKWLLVGIQLETPGLDGNHPLPGPGRWPPLPEMMEPMVTQRTRGLWAWLWEHQERENRLRWLAAAIVLAADPSASRGLRYLPAEHAA